MKNSTKTLWKLLEFILCTLTIEGIDFTDSFILNIFILSPIIAKILNKLSYYTCNGIVYRKLGINESEIGSMGYWISYIIYLLILYVILVILKNNNLIPIVTNLDTKIFYSIVDFFNKILMQVSEKIVNTLQI